MTGDQTAIVRVFPATDETVQALQVEVVRLRGFAEGLSILDQPGLERATDDLTLIANLKRAVETKRKEYVGPLNDHLKTVNEVFKTLSGPLEEADQAIRGKVLAYRREQERQAREAEEINRLREEAARREMELKSELTVPLDLVEAPAPLPARVRTDVGTIGTAKTRKWEVQDLTKVPVEYLMVDASKIGKVVRAGIPSIPGIRIWEEEGVRVTPRRS